MQKRPLRLWKTRLLMIYFLTFPFRRGNEMYPCDPIPAPSIPRHFRQGGYNSEPFAFPLHGKNR